MGRNRVNKFQRAIRHLKSNQIDEKLQLLSELPANNTSGLYILEPEYVVQDPEIPGEVTREADFALGDTLETSSDTTGLFDDDGTILTIEPPITEDSPDRSYILGPMASMYYGYADFTMIGYIRESDRRMVNLGRISGRLSEWDGESNFTTYEQLTLEQAVWFRDTPKYEDYRAYYPGPPSGAADEFGRYTCSITGTKKPAKITPPPRRIPPETGGPEDTGYPWGNNNLMFDKWGRNADTEKWVRSTAAPDIYGDLMILGVAAVLAKAFVSALIASSPTLTPRIINFIKNIKPPKPIKVKPTPSYPKPDPLDKLLKDLGPIPKAPNKLPHTIPKNIKNNLRMDYKVEGELISEEFDEIPDKLSSIIHNILKDMGGYSSENKEKLIKVVEKYKDKKSVKESREVLSESRKKILRDIKKPYKLPEIPKQKYNIKPNVIGSNRVINSDLMKKVEVPSSFKKPEERLWGKYEKKKNARNSQEKKNEVLDHLGTSDHAWEWLTETSRNKNNETMYGNFREKNKKSKSKVVRREEVKGDTLLFIVDENGKNHHILQSELSVKIANEFEKELFDAYFQEHETMQYDNDPLFKKVASKLKKEIDYPDKPSKAGYPNQPPPEMVNGWHPEYGKDKGYYNKLDPHSAEAMPSTGNSKIDAKVRKARRSKKNLGKRG